MTDPRPSLTLDDIRIRLAGETGPRLWRSLEELAEAPEVQRYLEAEFPDLMRTGAVDRRMLLRLMGASLALGGLAACSTEVPTGAPQLSQPSNTAAYVPGQFLYFATSVELNGYGRGVLVRAQDGRPVKLQGNDLHPASLGATDPFAEAEILSLYDPDRSPGPLEAGTARGWAEAERVLTGLRGAGLPDGGRGLHVLMTPVASPTVERLVAAAREIFPAASWHVYTPLPESNAQIGAALAFGQPLDAVYDLTQAEAVVALGGDLFSEAPGHIRYAVEYANRLRATAHRQPRLTAVESTPSLTGAKADRRILLRPHEVEAFARALLAAMEGAAPGGDDAAALESLAVELRRAGGAGLVTAGREQPPQVHAIAHAINMRIGAVGRTVRYIPPVLPQAGDAMRSIVALADALRAGAVSHLLILGGNPVYDAPAGLDLGALIRRAPVSLHLSYQRDETSAVCRWHLPMRHALESWGDLRAFDGTVGLCQPATVPLGEGRSLIEALALLVGREPDGRALVQATWREAWGDGFDSRWLTALERGVVEGTAFEPVPVSLRPDWDPGSPPVEPAGFTVTFAPDPSLWDGRFANNGWLQELPKPHTKQVWGNAALVSPVTAGRLELRIGDVIELTVAGRVLRAPVWILPGQAADTITLPLGYGRWLGGRIGSGIGFSAYAVRPAEAPWTVAGVTVSRTNERVDLVSTQQHHSLSGRDAIIRTVSADALGAGAETPALHPSIYPEWPYDTYAWGMAIDLDTCIGCNACVIACQAENNVPVVGPVEVERGREMHWLRIDRYYAGDPANPETYFQPLLCMHCEKAPCEVVCPVNATVHSDEGLNLMVYNRCIGTRTCSNNCPYKVRRFNFFDYRAIAYAGTNDFLNPQVTVRDQGVMEKCTYCVQRISAARIEAHIEGRRIRDGEVETACQQACPTQAIVFGDVSDPDTAVSRLRRSPRNYALLGDLNTQPRTTYLARVVTESDRPPAGSGEEE